MASSSLFVTLFASFKPYKGVSSNPVRIQTLQHSVRVSNPIREYLQMVGYIGLAVSSVMFQTL